jgi:branched-chain amino acid aminotransferase
MDEIVVACEENRIVEAFAVGTSYFVSPVSFIQYGEKALEIPMVEGSTGVYARLFKTWLKVIMYGLEKHDWAYLVESKE